MSLCIMYCPNVIVHKVLSECHYGTLLKKGNPIVSAGISWPQQPRRSSDSESYDRTAGAKKKNLEKKFKFFVQFFFFQNIKKKKKKFLTKNYIQGHASEQLNPYI